MPHPRTTPPAALVALGLALVLALLDPPSVAQSVQTAADGFTGCYAVTANAGGRRVLDAENADRRFTPASVTKLVTVAAALELLGPEHQVTTELYAAGAVHRRTLRGDLVLVAAGDPTWSRRFFANRPRAPLEALAEQAAQHLDRVEGDLVLDVSDWPGRPFPPSRAVAEIAYAYGAPTGGLAIDDNVAWLRISPAAKVGAPAHASWEGPAPYRIDNRTVTAPASRHQRGTFDVLPSWHGETLVVRGEYPISESSYRLPVALHDGELTAGRALRAALAAAGVEVAGTVRLSTTTSARTGARRLAAIASPPVAAWLREILEDSDNWLAEMLLRQIARVGLGEARTDDGAEWIVAELTRRAGLPAGSMHLEDGSGLSPHNLLTPRAVVELLLWSRSRSWWPVLAQALPLSGNGTLVAWPGLPATVRAKTGTLQHTVALAGLVGGRPGRAPIVFACFINHAVEDRPLLRARLARRVAGW